jgi:hypothetical protein
VVKGIALTFAGFVLSIASGCGRSQMTQELESSGGDMGSSGSTGVERGGTGSGGAAGNMATGGLAGIAGDGGKAGAGGFGAVGGAGPSGSGGSAGAGVPLTDAEVCADACAQTRHFLPNALCEDWRYSDDEPVAEYCLPVETLECTERCEQQLGAVSPACNAALHRAIPCVARTDLYQGGPIPVGCLFQECTRLLVRVTAACNGLLQELTRARQLWASAGSDSYSYKLSRATSVLDIVVKNGVASTVGETPTDVPTIPVLFDQIERSLEVVTSSVTYDATLGYPREAIERWTGCQGEGNYGYSFAVIDLVLE